MTRIVVNVLMCGIACLAYAEFRNAYTLRDERCGFKDGCTRRPCSNPMDFWVCNKPGALRNPTEVWVQTPIHYSEGQSVLFYGYGDQILLTIVQINVPKDLIWYEIRAKSCDNNTSFFITRMNYKHCRRRCDLCDCDELIISNEIETVKIEYKKECFHTIRVHTQNYDCVEKYLYKIINKYNTKEKTTHQIYYHHEWNTGDNYLKITSAKRQLPQKGHPKNASSSTYPTQPRPYVHTTPPTRSTLRKIISILKPAVKFTPSTTQIPKLESLPSEGHLLIIISAITVALIISVIATWTFCKCKKKKSRNTNKRETIYASQHVQYANLSLSQTNSPPPPQSEIIYAQVAGFIGLDS
ncbi:uncharacterized protein LOC128681792 isoform X3 [Plodia interpunctella]|uniref:uncharacterized protein LOC128681792 isoform X3 n=1 Tax=Plodia interpunctella TaxID=58824 RepID=UPI002367B98C|nr:uncharacterized protein LOC128681792 isoform X3 [Plodia interpunctella]